MNFNMKPTTEVGRSLPRLEARAKVTGRAEYTHHLKLPGMLHGKIFRSTMAHARIKSIDVSAARALEGVHAVITGQDILALVPEPYFGPAFLDQPVLALDKVRYVGEPVAVVLASDIHTAERAVQLIEAEYEELPAVFDEIEALTSKAIVHDVLRPSGTFPDLKHLVGRTNTNVALDYHLKRGDVAKGFEEADHVFEHTFRTQAVMHTPLEPIVSAADARDDRVVIHTASQSPSFVRLEIARLLGWKENQVRVKVQHLGGGFGAKLYIKLEALVTVLSLMVRKPVKISLTMEEQFYTITKHATTFRIKSGVNKDGKVIARSCSVWWNGGAYADIGPRVTQKSGFTAPGPYDIDNVEIESVALYTNRPPAGALRGFGIPQLVWAYESHTDIIARELGIDPLEMRRKNILKEGRPQATGTPMRGAEIEMVLERVAERMNWTGPFDHGSGTKKRGRGIAIGFKAVVAPTTSTALVTVGADGSVILSMSTVDMGQGSDTAMAQCVAEVLGIATEDIRVMNPDTDVTPYDMATLGSRSTYHMGNAVRLAAEDAKAKLKALAKEAGLPDDYDGPLRTIFDKRYGMQAGTVVGFGSFIPSYVPPDKKDGQSGNVTPFWMIGGTGVELEVDTETGHVTIERMINVVDCGTPLNPNIVATQLSGAAIMQIGFTMFEKMDFDAGQVTNASFSDYKIPGFHDIPVLFENHMVEAYQPGAPFGAKGVGESSTFGVSPAIAGAIEDAVGVRLTELPMTPESVYRAIRAQQNNPLEEN
jgi:CO/xanthine dehydrogenase Mo-binding subunit